MKAMSMVNDSGSSNYNSTVLQQFFEVLNSGDGQAAAEALLTVFDFRWSYQKTWSRWRSIRDALDLIQVVVASGPDAKWQGEFYGIRIIFDVPTRLQIILPSIFSDYEKAQLAFGNDFAFGERIRETMFNLCELLLQDTVALAIAVRKKLGNLPQYLYFRVSEQDGCYDNKVITMSRPLGSNSPLIPDGYFFSADGYKAHKLRVAADPLPWSARNDVAIWRGATTGAAFDSKSMERNERINLVYHCANRPDLFDVKLHRVVQVSESDIDAVIATLNERGVIGAAVDMDTFRHFKFALHIDGNTSAAGFFEKMALGCCVLRVGSQWEQWFEPRVQPWVHFIPIASDLTDLTEKIIMLKRFPDFAEKVARAGYEFAATASYYNEAIIFGQEIVNVLDDSNIIRVL